MIFISRHEPTVEQVEMARGRGFDLVHVGDADAFNVAAVRRLVEVNFPGVVPAVALVNPAMALNVASLATESGIYIGTFENEQRSEVGGKPTFHAKSLHVWQVFGDASYGVFPVV